MISDFIQLFGLLFLVSSSQFTQIQAQGCKGVTLERSVIPNCNPEIFFGPGINKRGPNEFTFAPNDTKTLDHGEAFAFNIIAESSCDKMRNCGGSKNLIEAFHKKCKGLSGAIGGSKKDGAGADCWNAAFGLTTNYVRNNPKGGK